MSDGDLSTPEGRRTLLNMIRRYRPKHVWMSLECKPWCAWNRFNAGRSVQSYSHVMEQQRASRQHVILCNVISKIQHDAGRRTHMENPRTSGVWELQELRTFIRRSVPAVVDQCMFGLKHPETRLPMQKQTRIQTTSMELFQDIDHQTCTKNHTHSVIAGSCHRKGHRIHVSRFAAFYPRLFARAIVRGIMKTSHTPYEEPICHVDTVEEPPNKRPRRHESQLDASHDLTNVWKPVFDVLKRQLPKSGVITLNNPQEEVFTEIQKRLPHENIGAIKAGKGFDRLMLGNDEWRDSLPRRHCLVMKRFSQDIIDLGIENWSEISRKRANRADTPSHIMICVFSIGQQQTDAENLQVPADLRQQQSDLTNSVAVPTWTP